MEKYERNKISGDCCFFKDFFASLFLIITAPSVFFTAKFDKGKYFGANTSEVFGQMSLARLLK